MGEDRHHYRLVESQPVRAPAELERSGQHLDFAFIDGWHTFDFTMVDFFFIDRMLKVGGVVAFDDSNLPAIRKVCRFVKTNLEYSVVGTDEPEQTAPLRRRVLERFLRNEPFRRFTRPDVIAPDQSIGLAGSCIAFRKEGVDKRSWDHFVDF